MVVCSGSGIRPMYHTVGGLEYCGGVVGRYWQWIYENV